MKTRLGAVALCLLGIALFSPLAVGQQGQAKWDGVDKVVVERFAEQNGRKARPPLVDTDRGDLLLFLFALAGAIGGFVVGYNWHKLFVVGKDEQRGS
jgi:ABC-type cobalt transport system substrate-binding protein